MGKSQAPAIVLAVIVALILMIAVAAYIVRGMHGYGKTLRRFEQPEEERPGARGRDDALKNRPGIAPLPPEQQRQYAAHARRLRGSAVGRALESIVEVIL